MRTKRGATKRRAKSRSAKKRGSIRRDCGARAAHELIVGVDGGNSKTDIILADTSGRLLAWVRVGGSNPQGIGLLPAAALLRSGIDAALARAKRRGERPAAVATTNAVPTNALPTNAVPTNALPTNALPTNALPAVTNAVK